MCDMTLDLVLECIEDHHIATVKGIKYWVGGMHPEQALRYCAVQEARSRAIWTRLPRHAPEWLYFELFAVCTAGLAHGAVAHRVTESLGVGASVPVWIPQEDLLVRRSGVAFCVVMVTLPYYLHTVAILHLEVPARVVEFITIRLPPVHRLF